MDPEDKPMSGPCFHRLPTFQEDANILSMRKTGLSTYINGFNSIHLT